LIRDLTESLDAFLNQPGLPPELGGATIVFDRPSDPFAPTETTVDLFLFDIRENLELRNYEPVTRRVGNQTLTQPPPLRVSCTYLVTAWPVEGLDAPKQEHRLLSQALRLFAATPTLPAAFLTGSLVGQEPPLPMLLAQPDGIRNPAEFWAALGGRMKASLLLTVVFSMALADEIMAPAVISSGIKINSEPLFFRIGGRVTDAATNPAPGAIVELVGRGRSTITNTAGEFTLAAVAPGTYTLRATLGPSTQSRAITVPAAAGDDYNVQLP
jgi:Pvc16 N-terminal domain/Carboxypeptidase regulatory-like domain